MAYDSKLQTGQFSVTGDAGSVEVQPGKSAEATLGDVAASDVQVQTTFILPSVRAQSFGVHEALEVRRSADGSAYRVRVKIGNSGKATLAVSRFTGGVDTAIGAVPLAFTVSSGVPVSLEVLAAGTNPVSIKARAWQASSSQPDWQYSTNDSSSARISAAGAVGLWTYVSGTASASIVKTTNLTAWTPTVVTPVPTSTAPPTVIPPPPAPASPSRGSAPVGTTSYPIPAGATFVSVNSGSDSNAGTLASPLKTIAAAVARAKSGSTIVLRGGTYNESVVVPTTIVIQSYPQEAVWLDGSVPVTNWTQSGSSWLSTGWTNRFDRSTSYTQGDTSTRFLDPAYPLAAWPDMVFVDGAQLKQVASANAVVTGTFFVDYGAKTIRIGTNPSGHEVRSSNKEQAFYVTAPNVTLQGFGVRRYGTSLPDSGAVRMGMSGGTVRNLIITDSATIGLSVRNAGQTVDHVTVLRSGMLGIGGNAAYGLVIKNSVVQGNNSEHFKPAPVSGGIKITRSRGLTVDNNDVSGNFSAGIWLDESCYDMKVTRNTTNGNSTTGIQLEISDSGIVADNQAVNNNMGVQIINTGNVKIFNNDIGNNQQYGVKLAMDTRRNSDTSITGHDPQRPNPDPTVPWIIKNVTVSNNVFGSGGLYQFYSLDGKSNTSTDAMKVTINGNLFNRWTASGQAKMVGWGLGDNKTVVHYANPADLAAAKNSAWHNVAVNPTVPVGSMGSAAASNANIAVGLPADVAAALGVAVGYKALGQF